MEVNCKTTWYKDLRPKDRANEGKLAGPMLIIQTYPPTQPLQPGVFKECHFHLKWESGVWKIVTNNCPHEAKRTRVQLNMPILRTKAHELCEAELRAIPHDVNEQTHCWTHVNGIDKGQFDLYQIQEKQLASTDLRGKIPL